MKGQEVNNANVVRWMLLLAVSMFGFAYLLVPLYNALCEATGLNGKTARADEQEVLATMKPEEGRTVTVEFVVNRNENFPWEFVAEHSKMEVHPGEVYATSFRVTNGTGETIIGQAVPSLAPGVAAKYFKKTECFCFTQQSLAAKEVKDMPVRFVVDPDLPKYVSTVTLSYTFFRIQPPEIKQDGGFKELSLNGDQSVVLTSQ